MNYSQTLEYLYSRLPMFHRIGAAAYKANLDNIIALSESLGHPEKNFQSVHIAGTNGKGSTSHMIASILQEAGYKTGLFTSPHLRDFRERIRINGNMIDEKSVISFVENYISVFDKINPSFFEWTTALAFKYFETEKVDIAIIETGLGGRLDSTNIITPVLSVITNISFDHMNLLGDTIEKIAGEKAGIIKKNIPVVIGERQMETENVFLNKTGEMKAQIVFASDNFKAETISYTDEGQIFRIHNKNRILFDELVVELKGNYQSANICTVLESMNVLKWKFTRINENNIKTGLQKIVSNTGLMGRWQVINKSPLTIADVAHNEAGIRFVVEQLEAMIEVCRGQGSKVKGQASHVARPTSGESHSSPNLKHQTSNVEPTTWDVGRQTSNASPKLHIVFGMVNDKNPSAILALLPKHAEYYFCKADMPRALDAEELKLTATDFNLNGESYPSVAEAYSSAKNKAEANDIIFIGGSTFVVAEIL